ncbi:quinolinate phosphoribosyltransferase-like protein [Campylobacter pinnipediorum subsp. caledonicus]|uniref:Putative pyrophosphorylase ModD n=1 Tax=Campylobacter pinnipediorum subsp. caledonicus TaxID=1874362 RepID=A0A1S6U922_9BACT|nr:ModD protein [Campylobacter pinnipediorum]AQW86510.1 quinolinate phosphoribosyltransferase-like protein [Campylobacter pinnipediorum subsp. caledonicus]AQW88162.1 quinolinate phosphoribosyltransferase-like protein [Campylobacter pinnipediorum subsp. caledonicus]
MTNLDDYIFSDVGFEDLTTSLQSDDEFYDKYVTLKIYTRERLILSGVLMALDIAKKFNCEVLKIGKNSDIFMPKDEIFSIKGRYFDIHKAWKLIQVLFEYSCKISTYTYDMVSQIKKANANCALLTTRKTFPFSKELCVQAVLSGGGNIHRFGLFDSVLFFDNHIKFYKNFNEFCEKIKIFKIKMPEKKIMVECGDFDDFKLLLSYDPDVIQCDKFSLKQLQDCLSLRDKSHKNINITASGGINLDNCFDYAKIGIDGIVTSAPYTQGVVNLGCEII